MQLPIHCCAKKKSGKASVRSQGSTQPLAACMTSYAPYISKNAYVLIYITCLHDKWKYILLYVLTFFDALGHMANKMGARGPFYNFEVSTVLNHPKA